MYAKTPSSSATEAEPLPTAAKDSLNSSHSSHGARKALMISALGVVFGDIGTSPLYAFRECFAAQHGIVPTADNVTGLLSVLLWSMMLVISIKYVAIIMKSDNRGEGGVLALTALLLAATRNWRFWSPIGAVGLFGAALFFGDGFITPPVSVLGALEGLTVIDAHLSRFVVPTAVLVLTILFFMQKHGTGAMGKAFGPVMLLWFATLAVLGIGSIMHQPKVLLAINPVYAAQFFLNNHTSGFVILSSVFLCVTGGEALYADMGHFGRIPIRNAWFVIALPSLVLNYFGQGALLLNNPTAVVNPFYLLAADWAQPILMLLAVAAAVIASQAVISGVFSVTRAALNLGYLPRLRVLHSSEHEIGQVYVPSVNWLLFIGTIILIIGFRSSSALAGAYGIAVSTTMLIDAILVIMLLRFSRAPRHRIKIALLATIAVLDTLFVASNSLKFPDGGWLPISVAVAVFLLMTTWSEGRRTLGWAIAREQTPLHDFLATLKDNPPATVAGTAVYLVSDASGVPRALTQNIRFNHVVHERNLFLTFTHPEIPRVAPEDRIEIENIALGFQRIIARYGFMETPNAIAALRAANDLGVAYKPEETIFVVGHDNPSLTRSSGMPMWRKRLFAIMSRNSQLAAVHYGTPAHRVFEVGSQVKL
jgi:KUP system potassium uptake protein